MVSLDDIELLISLVLFSAYLEGEKPLSAMIVSKVESGKSKLLERFSDTPGTVWVTDATAWGIAKHYGPDLKTGRIKHLLFPEFSIPIGRKFETVQMLDNFLCGLIEEGIGEIVSFRYKARARAPYGCGVIICISNQDFKDKEKHWFRIGLMSRLLPISYDYSDTTRSQIMDYIKERAYQKETKITLNLPSSSVKVDLPRRIADRLEGITQMMITGTELYGFRWQRHLQRLAMASALMRGDDTVRDIDFDLVWNLREYLNKDCTKQI